MAPSPPLPLRTSTTQRSINILGSFRALITLLERLLFLIRQKIRGFRLLDGLHLLVELKRSLQGMGDRRIGIIGPADRDLLDFVAIETQEIEILDIEGEPVVFLMAGPRFGHGGFEELIAALGIGKGLEMKLVFNQLARAPGDQAPRKRLF